MSPLPPRSARPYPLGPAMFWLAFLHLLLIAGVVHRAPYAQVIAIEAWIAVLIRDRAVRPLRFAVVRAAWITLLPPFRMGMPCPWTNRMWLPGWGWCDRGKPLEDRLERVFHKPMLVFAVLILPVLALEFVRADEVRSSPTLLLIANVGVAVIWVAFATEFVIKVSAARRPFVYSRDRWLDLAIVVLPVLEFALTVLADAAPLARLVRLSRAVAPEQLARMGQVYRLRGLVVKGWRAALVLRMVAWITRNTPQKQLRRLELQIADAEVALAELKARADELRRQVSPCPVEAPDLEPRL
jgi:hypothetical protein